MRIVRDQTGRFSHRPHFDAEELDAECEQAVVAFLDRFYGHAVFPISTDDLTKFLEQEADDLDLYADLSNEGVGVEGVTYLPAKGGPRVRIARELSAPQREHRLRTTLTHEWGHVHFHRSLWEGRRAELSLFPVPEASSAWRCHRDSIVNAPKVDWMEWQAGYVCGAVLMPRKHLLSALADLAAPARSGSTPAAEITDHVRRRFNVSAEAAHVRLSQLGLIMPSGGRALALGR